MDFLVVIPARFESTRFPGKPLARLKKKTLIKHVWHICSEVVDKERIIVATDHKDIKNHCEEEGMNTIMTSSRCFTGTDRVYEVSQSFPSDIYINVQGDEPLLSSSDLKDFIDFSLDNPLNITNCMTAIKKEVEFLNPNVPKVVVNNKSELLLISRSPIPTTKNNEVISAKKQVCIYSFPKEPLIQFGQKKSKSQLEEIEDIEILRFLEMGYKIRMFEIETDTFSIDTPEDLKRAERYLD